MLHRRAFCTFCASWSAGIDAVLASACAPAQTQDELTLRWQALRRQRGHFDGAAWNNDIDRWQGEKHVLMQALALRTREQRASRQTVLAAMGPPDAQWAGADPKLASATWQPQAPTAEATVLVYNWRAEHDRLLLALQGGHVVAAGWLHTYER